MFSPDFSQHWPPDHDSDCSAAASPSREDEPLSQSQQEALQALVDRINAARSVI